MNKKLVNQNVDFADSELEHFEFGDDNNLIISIKSWDAKIIKLKFIDVIQFVYKLGFQITGFYEMLDNNDFLNEALLRNYINIPINHHYKLFELEDISGFPFIQVVAEFVTIVKD